MQGLVFNANDMKSFTTHKMTGLHFDLILFSSFSLYKVGKMERFEVLDLVKILLLQFLSLVVTRFTQ